MDEDFVILVDYDNICRLCLLSTGAMSNIFAKYGKTSMQQQIFCITGLAVEKGDGLPSKICHRCRHVVEQACELRDVVDKSTKILAKTALTSNGQQSEVVHENEDESNLNSDDDNDDAATVIIESFENGTGNDLEDGTIIEEYDVCPESNDINEIIGNNGAHFEKSTNVPAAVTYTKSYGKKSEELVCQLCLDKFHTKEEVRTHVEEHYAGSDFQIYLDITSRPYLCTACDEVQLNRPQLVKHHRRHLGINPYKCKHPGCSYVGKNRDGIRHHKVVHEAPTRVCQVCGTAFRRRSDLVSHMVRLHPDADQTILTKHACASCGFKASNEPALRRHMKAHHFVPRFPCPYGSCDRSYRSARALADHERAHQGQRRYRCPLCNLIQFTNTKNLKQHMLMHSRSRKSSCDLCPATFDDYKAFCRHLVAHHPALQLTCRACKQLFESETQLSQHMQACERLQRLFAHIQEQTQNGHTDSQDSMDSDEQASMSAD